MRSERSVVENRSSRAASRSHLLSFAVRRGSERHNFEEEPRGPQAPPRYSHIPLVRGDLFPLLIGSLTSAWTEFRQGYGSAAARTTRVSPGCVTRP